MGMASSQVRLLAITNRLHDIEYKAQCLQNAKIRLAMDEDEAYQEYQAILDATTLTVKSKDGTTMIPGTFENLMANSNELGGYNFAFVDEMRGALIVPDDVYKAFIDNPNASSEALALAVMGKEDVDIMSQFGEGGKYSDIVNNLSTTIKPDLYKGDSSGYLEKIMDFLQKNAKHIKVFSYNEDGTKTESTNLGEQVRNLFESANPTDSEKKERLKFITGQTATVNSMPIGIEDLRAIEFDNAKMQEDWKTLVDDLEKYIYNDRKSEFTDGDELEEAQLQKYLTMFNMIKVYAGSDPSKVVSIANYHDESASKNACSDSNWLQDQLQSGRFTIRSFRPNAKEDKLVGESVATNTRLNYTPETTIDKQKLAKAEAEYEYKLKQIDRKDKQYDTELSKLEAERNALNTERDGIKKVMEDNVDRTFGLFS